ncbi:MAG: ABC transporter permease subunit [Verrucomicrobiota bacterium]
MKASRWGIAALHVITWALLIVVAAPVLVVLAGAFINPSFLGVSSERWVTASSQGMFGQSWFAYVFNLYGRSMQFSLLLALLSIVVCLVVSVPAAYGIVRSDSRASRLLEEVTLLPLSIPGIAMSIGLIQAYAIVRGQWWLILGGHVLYTVPLMMRVLTNALRSLDLERLEHTATSLGANKWQQFAYVVIPNLRHSIIVGSLLVFAISWGEFNVSFLLNTPLHQTYPAALYATYTANSFAVSSAATTIFLAVIIPVLLALQWIGGREFTRLEQGA